MTVKRIGFGLLACVLLVSARTPAAPASGAFVSASAPSDQPVSPPADRAVSPRRVAPPTRIPDPIVAAPAGTAVSAADVPRAVRRAVVADAARRFNVAQSAVVIARAE